MANRVQAKKLISTLALLLLVKCTFQLHHIFKQQIEPESLPDDSGKWNSSGLTNSRKSRGIFGEAKQFISSVAFLLLERCTFQLHQNLKKEINVKDLPDKFEKSYEPQKRSSSLEGISGMSRGVFWEARTRIFVWYVLLITLLVGLSIPIFTQLVFFQVDKRVIEDLREEVESFEEFTDKFPETEKFVPGNTPQEQTRDIFDAFLHSKIPSDKTFLVAIIDGEFYRSSPVGLPKALNRDSEAIIELGKITEPLRGKNILVDEKFGDLLYKAEPLEINNQVMGVLVAAYITFGEEEEVLEAVIIAIEVLVLAFVIGLIFAWLAAGRVLKPIRTLIQTARTISETQLGQRIPVNGQGEMGELAATFNRMMDRLETSFTSQREFVNDAGHELRTPITIIRGHLELLEDDPEERQETVNIVLDELDRMTRFVEDLILLAKAERRDFLQLDLIDIEQFTEELYFKAQGLADRNWELEAIAIGIMSADRQKITQAIMNLAQNATQHTKETDSIILGSSIEQNYVRIWVRDTGTGIKLDDQERIFNRFARAAHSRRRSEGAGLGLSIVQAIAETHGGQIELHSEPERGSKFTLILPLRGTIDISQETNP